MKTRSLILLLLLAVPATALAAPSTAVVEAQSRRAAIMEKVKDCVLAIFPLDGEGGGSGVVISSDGYALSNFHVVAPCGYAMQCGMTDGKLYDAVLVGVDPTGDVALIKLLGRENFPVADIGNSDIVRVGDAVFAMGNPFLLAADFQPTVTYGIVSGIHRYQFPAGTLLEYTDCLQIDASINPGNSGGPLFNENGELIGINGRASFEKRGRVNVGAAYAISINQIKNFLGDLHSGRIVDHASLGVKVTTDNEGRVVVSDILETSDAYRRGLRYDDEIVSLAGRQITTPNGFKNILGTLPKGWRVPLSYRRNGKRFDILVRLAGVHSQEELLQNVLSPPKTEPLPIPKSEEKLPPDDKKTPTPPKISKKKPETTIPVPEIVKQHYQAKRGFANYYFNLLNQERLWKNWSQTAALERAKGSWHIKGKSASGADFTLHLTDTGVTLKLSTEEINWTAGEQLDDSLPPPHSGGMLPALYLWHRLASLGFNKFGEVYYHGTAPLFYKSDQATQFTDVLIAAHKGVECRFYFDQHDGRLLALEMFPQENTDPCEIYFYDYQESQGALLPKTLEVRYGEEQFAVLKLTEFRYE